jgi:hypothetical protein
LFGQAERVPIGSSAKRKPLLLKRPATWLAARPIAGSVPIRTSATMESAYELTSGGLSHETQSDLGLCSMVVLVVVHCEAQRALVPKPLVEKTVTQLSCPLIMPARWPAGHSLPAQIRTLRRSLEAARPSSAPSRNS